MKAIEQDRKRLTDRRSAERERHQGAAENRANTKSTLPPLAMSRNPTLRISDNNDDMML